MRFKMLNTKDGRKYTCQKANDSVLIRKHVMRHSQPNQEVTDAKEAEEVSLTAEEIKAVKDLLKVVPDLLTLLSKDKPEEKGKKAKEEKEEKEEKDEKEENEKEDKSKKEKSNDGILMEQSTTTESDESADVDTDELGIDEDFTDDDMMDTGIEDDCNADIHDSKCSFGSIGAKDTKDENSLDHDQEIADAWSARYKGGK